MIRAKCRGMSLMLGFELTKHKVLVCDFMFLFLHIIHYRRFGFHIIPLCTETPAPFFKIVMKLNCYGYCYQYDGLWIIMFHVCPEKIDEI